VEEVAGGGEEEGEVARDEEVVEKGEERGTVRMRWEMAVGVVRELLAVLSLSLSISSDERDELSGWKEREKGRERLSLQLLTLLAPYLLQPTEKCRATTFKQPLIARSRNSLPSTSASQLSIPPHSRP
jgi:hypothetical protein